MQRRDFFRSGAQAALAGAAAAASVRPVSAAVSDAEKPRPPSILKSYTAEDHRRRLRNIGVCGRGIRSSMRKHLVTDYLPGQCCYNLGEYPCRKPWDPGEYDEREALVTITTTSNNLPQLDVRGVFIFLSICCPIRSIFLFCDGKKLIDKDCHSENIFFK